LGGKSKGQTVRPDGFFAGRTEGSVEKKKKVAKCRKTVLPGPPIPVGMGEQGQGTRWMKCRGITTGSRKRREENIISSEFKSRNKNIDPRENAEGSCPSSNVIHSGRGPRKRK